MTVVELLDRIAGAFLPAALDPDGTALPYYQQAAEPLDAHRRHTALLNAVLAARNALSDGRARPVPGACGGPPDTFVGDVVTKPAVPPLIEAARRVGCRTSTGGDMFATVAGLIADFLLAEGPLRSTP